MQIGRQAPVVEGLVLLQVNQEFAEGPVSGCPPELADRLSLAPWNGVLVDNRIEFAQVYLPWIPDVTSSAGSQRVRLRSTQDDACLNEQSHSSMEHTSVPHFVPRQPHLDPLGRRALDLDVQNLVALAAIEIVRAAYLPNIRPILGEEPHRYLDGMAFDCEFLGG